MVVKINFEPNTGPNSGTIPYFLMVEIGASELDWERTFRIPVLLSHGITYVIEACGMKVKADTLKELGPLAQSLMLRLQNMSRMPTYVFIARRSRRMYPVYTVGDKVIAVTPQGLVFRHVELAKVREYLTDYLERTGVLGPIERGDKLHVRGVHKKRLSLIQPTFYLKKRPLAGHEHEFWAPVFPDHEENIIYVYAANTKHEVQINQGSEIFELRANVAKTLLANQRLTSNYNLRIDRLQPNYWEQIKHILTILPQRMVYEGIKLPMYQGPDFLVALEYRSAEDRYSLFLAEDAETLQYRIAQDLVRRKFIDDAASVHIERN